MKNSLRTSVMKGTLVLASVLLIQATPFHSVLDGSLAIQTNGEELAPQQPAPFIFGTSLPCGFEVKAYYCPSCLASCIANSGWLSVPAGSSVSYQSASGVLVKVELRRAGATVNLKTWTCSNGWSGGNTVHPGCNGGTTNGTLTKQGTSFRLD